MSRSRVVGVIALSIWNAIFAIPHIILPGQESLVMRMLDAGTPVVGCQLERAAVESDHILASYHCPRVRSEIAVTLRHPDDAPAGAQTTEKFAISTESAEAPARLIPEIVRRVRASESAWQWAEPPPSEPPAVQPPPPPRPRSARTNAHSSNLSAYLLATFITLLPLTIGGLCAFWFRRKFAASPTRRRRGALIASLAMVILATLIDLRIPYVSLYDAVLFALLFSAANIAGAWPEGGRKIPRGGVVFSSVLTLAGLALLELWARKHRKPIPAFGPPYEQRFIIPLESQEFGCKALFADTAQRAWFDRMSSLPGPVPAGGRRIMHIGDSMTAGYGVTEDATFEHLLESTHPNEQHLNLGISNVGTDAELLVARDWIPRLHPDLVVLHVFLGNDIAEIDRPFGCCNGESLLSYDSGGPHRQCTEMRWYYPLSLRLQRGPVPYAARVFGSSSELVHSLSYGVYFAIAARIDDRPTPMGWAHFDTIIRALRNDLVRANVPLAIAIMPLRDGIDRPPFVPFDDTGVLARIRNTIPGVPVFSAQSTFLEHYRSDTHASWFQADVNDPHMGPAGHQLYARWLAEQLDRLPRDDHAPRGSSASP